MGHRQRLDEGNPAALPQPADPPSPLVALGRLEGEAAHAAAVFLRSLAITLPGGSEFRSELLASAREYRTLALVRGVHVPSAASSGRSRRR
jgi:hypothetical protein